MSGYRWMMRQIYIYIYRKLNIRVRGNEGFLFILFRKIKALSSTQYFGQRVLLNRLPTQDNLLKRGIMVKKKKHV